jgi:hypothetical protein
MTSSDPEADAQAWHDAHPFVGGDCDDVRCWGCCWTCDPEDESEEGSNPHFDAALTYLGKFRRLRK